MKTVMKKMFSLLLVAVLLVSAVPTAFAAVPGDTITCSAHQVTATHDSSLDVVATCKEAGKKGYMCPGAGTEADPAHPVWSDPYTLDHSPSANVATCENPVYCLNCKEVLVAVLPHTPGAAATCTTAQTCTACGTELTAALNHTGGAATCSGNAVCTRCSQPYGGLNATNHSNVATAWTYNTTKHWHACSGCSVLVGEADHTWTNTGCTSDQICSVCGYNPGNDTAGHDWDAANCTDPRTCSDCGATDGNPLGHNWILQSETAATCTAAGSKVYYCGRKDAANNQCPETKTDPIPALGHDIGSNGVCDRRGCGYEETDRVVVEFYLDYNEHKNPVTKTVAKGTKLYNIYTPSRGSYAFEGWYTVSGNRVSESATVTEDSAYFAKWTQMAPHEVYVKFYTHGNTKTVAKYVDMHHYAHDGVVSLEDLEEAAAKYFKARDKQGLFVEGPFSSTEWDTYCDNSAYRNPREKIEVSKTSTTVIHAMVRNVSDSKTASASKADSTNPKTGDEIFTPIMIMGASASCLAVLFYLNKKRAY